MGAVALVIAVGWCAGIAFGGMLALPGPIALLGAAAAVCAAMLTPSPRTRLLALGLVALLLGQARVAFATDGDGGSQLADHAGEIVVRGRLADDPVPRGRRAEVVVVVEAVSEAAAPRQLTPLADPKPAVLLRAATIQAGHGDLIEVRGQLARPRSRPGWPLAEMLARRGVYWTLDAGFVRVVEGGGASLFRWLADVRRYAEGTARAVLPEPHASLISGMVFGARAGLPPDLRAALVTTGTSHLTAVSGANVAMVAGTLLVLAVRIVGRGPASLVAIVGVWLYALLVGAPPSALRAATMATLALAVQGLGRQPDAIAGLSLAAALLLGWDPGLAFDLGFQLSVSATAGLILLSPAIEGWLAWIPNPARGWLAVAVAAQLATLPIVLGTFQRLSLISLPANILAAPLVPSIMAVGAALAVLGRLPVLDVVLGWAAWALTGLLLLVIQTCASVPGAVIAVGRLPAWLTVAWYGVLGCRVAAGSADVKSLGVRPAWLNASALASVCLVLLGLLVGWAQADRSGAVTVALLDVEPGAALVRAGDGRTALLLTAEPGPGLIASIGGQLELWESSVDVVIGPGGMQTDIDLLALGQRGATAADVPAADDADPPPEDDLRGATVEPGTTVDLGGALRLLIVDVRQAGDRPVLDLAILTDSIAFFLPGPGAPGQRWADVAPDRPTVARLPVGAVTWARSLPARSWLLLVGEPGQARARGDSGVPFLTRREHGLIEVTVAGGQIGVRTERCGAGQGCLVELPPPSFVQLLPASPE